MLLLVSEAKLRMSVNNKISYDYCDIIGFFPTKDLEGFDLRVKEITNVRIMVLKNASHLTVLYIS